MSFDEIQFPLRLEYGAKGGPRFATEVVTLDNGYEMRVQHWSQARLQFDARTGLHSKTDVATLLNFFYARAGKARGFRLQDWNDYSSAATGTSAPATTDQIIGTGNGSTTQFQLIKNYSSGAIQHTRIIRKPVTVILALNAVVTPTGWSLDSTTGIITFASAPTNGTVITAGYLFDVPVRFDTDNLAVTTDDYWLARSEIPLVEVRLS